LQINLIFSILGPKQSYTIVFIAVKQISLISGETPFCIFINNWPTKSTKLFDIKLWLIKLLK